MFVLTALLVRLIPRHVVHTVLGIEAACYENNNIYCHKYLLFYHL